MSSFITSLDLYLAHASSGAVFAYAGLGILTVGLGPFALADLIQHIATVRRGEVK